MQMQDVSRANPYHDCALKQQSRWHGFHESPAPIPSSRTSVYGNVNNLRQPASSSRLGQPGTNPRAAVMDAYLVNDVRFAGIHAQPHLAPSTTAQSKASDASETSSC